MKQLALVSLAISSLLAVSYEAIGVSNYYYNAGCRVEARFIALPEHVSATKDIRTIDGKLVKVTTKTIFSPSDILGVEVEDNSLTIHFKRDAWARVREETLQAKGRQVALIKDGVIFQMVPLMSGLDRAATLTTKKLNLDEFLRGFKAGPKPENLDSQTEYVSFLEEWRKKHPEDTGATAELANAYMIENTNENCTKAIIILEELLSHDPTELAAYHSLIQCYVATKQFEKAIRRTKKAIKISPGESQWFLHIVLGALYVEIGRKAQARRAYEQSLDLLKAVKVPDMSQYPGLSEVLSTKFGLTFNKEEAIEKLNQLVEELQSSQDSQK